MLIGWSFFQGMPEFGAGLEFEPCGYFRKRDWFGDTESLVIIGEKGEAPKLADVYKEALRWNIEIARRPEVNGIPNGWAAYTAWADALSHDENFPAGDEATLRHRHSLHEMAVGTVAENRWYGGQFLLEAADHVHYSQIEDLFVAAARLAAEHDLMWQVWDAAGGNGNPDAWAQAGRACRAPQDRPADPGRAGQGYGRRGAPGARAGDPSEPGVADLSARSHDLDDQFACPECKAALTAITAELRCRECTARYPILDGVPDLFAGETEHGLANQVNNAWLDPAIVEARQTVYDLSTRELRGMAFCMAEIGRRSGPGCRILEVGMGTGHFTRWLSEVIAPGTRIFAFDFSWPIIAQAKRNAGGLPGVTLFRANARGGCRSHWRPSISC